MREKHNNSNKRVCAIMGTVSSDAVKGKKRLGISLILVIVFLMFIWLEIFAYGIGIG